MTIDNEYDFQDIVFLKTDDAQKPRMVTSIKIHACGVVLYGLSCGTDDSYHYGFEISATKDFSK